MEQDLSVIGQLTPIEQIWEGWSAPSISDNMHWLPDGTVGLGSRITGLTALTFILQLCWSNNIWNQLSGRKRKVFMSQLLEFFFFYHILWSLLTFHLFHFCWVVTKINTHLFIHRTFKFWYSPDQLKLLLSFEILYKENVPEFKSILLIPRTFEAPWHAPSILERFSDSGLAITKERKKETVSK